MAHCSKSKSEIAVRVGAAAVLALVSTVALCESKRWTLPVAYGGPEPSPPSIHGYLVAAGKQRLSLKRDSRDGSAGTSANVQLTSKTELFTAYGGLVTPDQLQPGQYVWVWYMTADTAKAGTPPRAAVVIVWSTSASDKPSQKVRWSYDRKK